MESLGMNILRENLGDILEDRKRKDLELTPINNIDVIGKGLKYSLIDGKIDRRRLREYTDNYGIDSRYKIKILVSNEYEEYYFIKGAIQYKKGIYKFYIMDNHVNIKKIFE